MSLVLPLFTVIDQAAFKQDGCGSLNKLMRCGLKECNPGPFLQSRDFGIELA